MSPTPLAGTLLGVHYCGVGPDLARLHKAGVLPEAVRSDAVTKLAEFAVDSFDPG